MAAPELIALLGQSTSLLAQTITTLDPDDVSRPSTLPGWSRGHLLTHLANNAEGLTRLILGAQSGRSLPMYSSTEARNGDISAGATRAGSIIIAHTQLATATLDVAIAGVVDWETPVVFSTVAGPTEKPLTELLRMRLREVAIHHVDLAAGHHFDDEGHDVIIELTRDAARRLSTQSDDSIDLLIDGTTVASITSESLEPAATVDLSAGSMLGWLTGRDAPRPDLPQLPNWG